MITGVAGFVGSHVAELFLARGDAVVGLDNFDDYYSPAIKRANVGEVRAGPGGDRFELIEGDVRDRILLGRIFSQGFDVVVHMAGRGGVRASLEHPHHSLDVNTIGTLNVLEAARCNPVGNLLVASTSSAYGNSEKRPFVETDPADRPLAPYPASKRAAEMLAYAYHHNYGLNCTILRFFTVYGPRNRPDMMAYKVLDSLYTGRKVPLYDAGEAVRDWTYVEDVARGVVAAADRPLGYEIVNLGRGEPVRLLDFIRRLEQVSGRRASFVPSPRMGSDAVATAADIEKARRLLGYAPGVSVREGVEHLWRWYVRAVAGQATRGSPRVGEPDER